MALKSRSHKMLFQFSCYREIFEGSFKLSNSDVIPNWTVSESDVVLDEISSKFNLGFLSNTTSISVDLSYHS